MTIVSDNNDHEHGPCSSDKHQHRSNVVVGMWHVNVINHEEYELYKCCNCSAKHFNTTTTTSHIYGYATSEYTHPPAFLTGTAIGGTFDGQ